MPARETTPMPLPVAPHTNPAAPLPTIRQTLARVHRRLVLLAVLLSGALLMASGFFIIREYFERNLTLVARTIGYTVEPAIVFGDPEAIRESMGSVAGMHDVRQVELRDAAGRLLARWAPPGKSESGTPTLADRLLEIAPGRETIRHGSERIGEVRVIGDTRLMANYLLTGALISLSCLGITVIASRLLMRRMEEDVVRPLARIASVAHTVRRHRAFGLRVPHSAIAEIDTFSTDFNALLAELQGWHTSLTREKDQLAHQATHDSLTALGNRALFEHRLGERVDETVRSGAPFGLLYLDADFFKQVNDTHGHLAGDALLVGIAARIRACIRQHDQAFRLGGDEFAVILTPALDRARLDAVIRRIELAMDEPVELASGEVIRPSLSIGAAIYPDDGISPQDLLRRADEAMYQHKLRKRGDFSSTDQHA